MSFPRRWRTTPMRGESIGVLGGTFDPVHVGHLELARSALRRLPLAGVALLPCAVPPHKVAPHLAPAIHRRAMLDLAVADDPRLTVCTVELDRGGVSYTLETMRTLRRGAAGRNPVFLMGMDSLLDLPTSYRCELLLDEFHLVVFDRCDRSLRDVRRELHPAVAARLLEVGDAGPGTGALDPPDETRPARVFHVLQKLTDVSSREIRDRVRRGQSLGDLVPAAVGEYIQTNRLYAREDRP